MFFAIASGAVQSDGKGLYALGMLSHEASIIATKERAEMKMIEFFMTFWLIQYLATFLFHLRHLVLRPLDVLIELGDGVSVRLVAA